VLYERRIGSVIELTLDTPGCDVNIFDAKTAVALTEALERATDARAIVIRSAKESSFVNGAQLVMASAARSAEDVRRLTTPVRNAYRALRESPIPTIAAIRGSCFGCGVELTLHCQHRVAADTWETQFYMTEIADYLLVPAFGSTQDLTLLLGLEPAVDLLLWGARWTSGNAVRHGLVDAVFDDQRFDREVLAYAERLAPRPTAPPVRPFTAADAEVARVTRERIATLPQDYVETYLSCFEVMEKAARNGVRDPALYEEEIERCGASIARPLAKAALSFFFVRQLAERSVIRGSSPVGSYALAIEGPELASLRELIENRNIRAVRAAADDFERHRIALAAEGRRVRSEGEGDAMARVRTHITGEPIGWGGDAFVYLPLLSAGRCFAEVAVREPSSQSFAVFHALTLAGFSAVLSRPESELAIDALFRAFLRPVLAFIAEGGAPSSANAALHDFGFVDGPAELLAMLSDEDVAALFGKDDRLRGAARAARTPVRGNSAPEVADAVLLSLLAWALTSRDRGLLSHPSVADVAAREVVGFPLGRSSLLRTANVDFAKKALPGLRKDSLDPGSRERVERFIKEGKDVYS
jgi:enoyl-CoA hydratase/carnithine racemase